MKNYALPLALLIMVLISGCTPQAKLRRAKRLIAQAEASGLEWKSDTVFTTITLEVPTVKIDTVVTVQNWRDTITVTRDRVTTRVVVNPVARTVYIASKCDSVVVIRKVPHTVTREIRVGDSWFTNAKQWFLWLIIGAGAMWVLVRFRVLR
jgi:hypothetical protein